MINSFYENLLTCVRERQLIYMQSVCAGHFKTLDDYKFVSGKLKGIEECEKLIKNQYREMFQMNDISGTKELDENEE